ncbi:MAG TPA: HEAT repeat domain-containing protein [Tepidisphaeraceae bacterium]|nr:HEAT repeat domain-containing protein [Tepidisphaeraceae bacterium]
MRAAALALTQPMTGENATAKLVGKLAEVDAPRRAEIVSALGYRGDAGARSAAMKALDDADAVVRVAAIGAVARGATSEGIAALLNMLNSRTGAEAKAIQDSLARMPGEAPLAAVAAALPKASASARVVLLQILASRRDRAHVDPVLAAMTDADGAVRVAAIKALGELGEAKALPSLIDLVVTSKGGKEQTEGMQSIVAICQRNSDAQKRAEPVLGALSQASCEAKAVLIRSLSQLGGTEALEAVIKETSGGDAAIADAAVRTLADWREVGAAGALLKISQSSEKANHRVLALRGYLRLVGLRSDRPAEETIGMYQEALKAAQRPDEKRLALAGLSSVRTVGALKVVATYLEDETLAAEAAMAAVKIALPQKESEQPLKGAEAAEILRKVAASAKDPAIRNQASRYVEGAEKR